MSNSASLRLKCAMPLLALFLSTVTFCEGQSPNDVGVRPAQAYDGDKESVGLANGNVNIQLPLFSLKTRGDKTRTFSFSYNSSFWNATVVPGEDSVWSPSGTSAGAAVGAYGWQMNFPSAFGAHVDKGDGALTTFPGLLLTGYFGGSTSTPTGSVETCLTMYAVEGAWGQNSAIQCDPNNGVNRYLFEDGSQIQNGSAFGSNSWGILDANGNRTDYTWNQDGGTSTLVLDTGATVTLPNGSNASTVQYTDADGVLQKVHLIYGQPGAIDTTAPTFTYPVSVTVYEPSVIVDNPHVHDINRSDYGSSDPYMLTAIVLPNGGSYTFHYDAYYEIDKITYPDGGYTRYDFAAKVNEITGHTSSSEVDYRQVVAKHVCTTPVQPFGSTTITAGNTCSVAEETTTYAPVIYSYGGGLGGANAENTVTYPDGTSVQHFFMESLPGDCLSTQPMWGLHCDSPDIGTITRDASGNIVAASTSLTDDLYGAAAGASLGCPSKIAQHTDWLGPVSLTRYVEQPQSANEIDSSHYGYGIETMQAVIPGGATTSFETKNYTYDSECRVTDIVESASGVGVVSHQHTDYVTGTQSNGYTYDQVNTDEDSPYLPELKSEEITYDGSGNILTQAKYYYDNYGSAGISTSGGVQRGRLAYQYEVLTDVNQGVVSTMVTRPAFMFGTSFIPRGNLTSKSVWRNTDGAWLASNYGYDDAGNVLTSSDAAGNVTTFSFADSWQTGACAPSGGNAAAFASSVQSPSGLVTTSNHTCTGSVGSTTDPNGETQTGYYDSLNRQIQSIAADGGVTSTCYTDSIGQSCSSTSLPLMKYTTKQIDSQTTMSASVQFDGVGRTVISGLLSDPYGADYTTTTYDVSGWVASVSQPYRGTPSLSTNSAIATSKFYDALGRLIQQQNPYDTSIGASSKTWGYGPVDDTATDESGKQIKRVYDGAGRLVAVCEPGSNQDLLLPNLSGATGNCNAADIETDYGYDSLNNLISVNQHGTDGIVSRSFTYDSLSRLLTAQNPETGTITYKYTSSTGGLCAGNTSLPCSVTDARGITRTFTYDNENRLIGKTYSDGTPTATYSYGSSSATQNHHAGRLISESTSMGSTTLTSLAMNSYDPMGRVWSETQCVLAVCNTVPYTYDYAGNVRTAGVGNTGTSLTQLSYTPDAANRIDEVTTNWSDASHPGILFQATNYDVFGVTAASFGLASSGGQGAMTLTRSHNIRSWPTGDAYTPVGSEESPTSGSAQIAISGSQPQASEPTPGTIKLTINGTGTYRELCATGYRCVNLPLSGANLTITVGNFTTTASYAPDPGDASSVLVAIANALNVPLSPVKATPNNAKMTITSIATGAGSNYPLTIVDNDQSGSEDLTCTAATAFALSGGTGTSTSNVTVSLAPGFTSIPDSGVLLFFMNANSGPAEISYTSSDTPGTIAQKLAQAVGSSCTAPSLGDGPPSTYATAVAQGSEVLLTDCPGSQTPDQISTELVYTNGVGLGSSTSSMVFTIANGEGLYSEPAPSTGTVKLWLNGTQAASVSYGASSTAASIAAALASQVSGASAQTDGFLTITGSPGESYAVSILDNSGHASPFTAYPGSATLSTGALQSGTRYYAFDLSQPGAYAPNGNIVQVADSLQGTWGYGYDWLNRLTSASNLTGPYSTDPANNPATINWTYDSYGNRLSQSLTGSTNLSLQQPLYSYVGNANRVEGFCYDAAGNMMNSLGDCGFGSSITYDAEERISRSGAVIYLYDAAGRRVAKGTGNSLATVTLTNIYILDGAGRDITEQDGSGNWKHTDVYGPEGVLATYDSVGVHFYLHDWLGTKRAQALYTGSGQALQLEGVFPSLPFGEDLPAPLGYPVLSTPATEKQFTGKERDVETGNDYFGARYYVSSMGRWMSPDWSAKAEPIPYAKLDNPQSLNLYAYIFNDPLATSDIDGHEGAWSLIKSVLNIVGIKVGVSAGVGGSYKAGAANGEAHATLASVEGHTGLAGGGRGYSGNILSAGASGNIGNVAKAKLEAGGHVSPADGVVVRATAEASVGSAQASATASAGTQGTQATASASLKGSVDGPGEKEDYKVGASVTVGITVGTEINVSQAARAWGELVNDVHAAAQYLQIPSVSGGERAPFSGVLSDPRR